MSYHPDQEFCLVTFEEQESNPFFKGTGFWASFSMTQKEKASFAQYKTTDKRNSIRRDEAVKAINAARRDRYKPIFGLFQKGEVLILGIKGRRSRWDGVTTEKIIKGTYTEKIRSIVSIRINRKGNFRDIGNWKEAIKIAETPKPDARGGGTNEKKTRNNSNEKVAPANKNIANKSGK